MHIAPLDWYYCDFDMQRCVIFTFFVILCSRSQIRTYSHFLCFFPNSSGAVLHNYLSKKFQRTSYLALCKNNPFYLPADKRNKKTTTTHQANKHNYQLNKASSDSALTKNMFPAGPVSAVCIQNTYRRPK